ncbi:MAG: beta-galactosidase trimerization domain-containing protein [Bryobacterales bacterium]|nr:beta-galactosidase trimerization domain-containing protein [Bryobacterales bacterium]
MKPLGILAFLTAALSAQPAPEPWWRREPLRILDLVTSFGDARREPVANLAARKAALFFNAEHLEIMDLPGGLDDRGFYFQTKAGARRNRDYLREYMPAARARGLRVFIYFNVHWYKPEFGRRHAGWLQIREDGSPLDGVYQTGTDFCVNSPFREWAFQILRDLAAYGVDGIFYDGPIFRPDTCYCTHCRRRFQEQFHRDMPSKKVRKGPAFQQLLRFQAESLARFLADSRQVLKSTGREIALYMNGGVLGGNWATARLNRVLVPHQDLLGSEGGFIYSDLSRIPLWKPGVTARLLETQAGGKPTVIFAAAAHKPWTFSLLPAPELRLLHAGSIANGAGIWFGLTPFEFRQPEMDALAEMNRRLAANARYYTGSRSAARIALVWSDSTANVYEGSDAQMIDIQRIPQRSEVGNLSGEFWGLAEALIRAQAPFDVIDDVTLERESLDRYAAVFLPNVAVLGDRAALRLTDYVRGGGHLFATFETSLYDRNGARRRDFALAGVFGVNSANKVAGPRRWDFLKPLAPAPLLKGLERELIPSPSYYLRVRTAGARPLLRFTEPLAGPYDGIPPLSPDPALTLHTFGKGYALYCAGDLGAAIQSFRFPEFLALVENAARVMAPPSLWVENAPSSVELVHRSQPGERREIVHLVNFTGEMVRPIRKTLPLSNLCLVLRGGPVRKAFTLVRPRNLEAQPGPGGVIRLNLPTVDEYEVVVIER